MKLELCAASTEAIRLAKELNFDRIELCQNLEQGGITPSLGMIEYALANDLETHVLIRPRSGGFFYSEDEIEVMLRDMLVCREIGVQGVVVGALNQLGEIDAHFLSEVMEKSAGMQVTYHRAFDDVLDWKKSIDILIDHNVNRVLSSGLARNVDIGFPILKEMITYSSGKIDIMVGGGVNAGNVSKIKKELLPDAIHFSGTSKHLQDEDSLFSESVLKVDKLKIIRVLESLSLT
jgi:copper homeostasis protein